MDELSKKQLEAFEAFNKVVDDQLKAQALKSENERVRRAAMTPEQRAAEDHAIQQQQLAARETKDRERLTRMGPTVLARESFTLTEFCWLLALENPDKRGHPLVLEMDSAAQSKEKFFKLLASSVNVTLHPLNPSEPTDKHRFETQALIERAYKLQLGCANALRPLLHAVEQSAPAPVHKIEASKLAASGTQTRERGTKVRRQALVKFARSLVNQGEGSETADGIRLSISGVELSKRFKAQHPEWKNLSNSALTADRAACKPRIFVTTGRPPHKDS